MTVNGYPYVRRLRQRCSEHREQCSPAITRTVVGELASGTHGKPRGEDVVNLVRCDRRNAGGFRHERTTPEPKRHAACRRCFFVTVGSSYMQPGKSVSLKVLLNVNGGELGHLVVPRGSLDGIHNASEGDGTASVGRRRKRKPPCNEADRAATARGDIVHPKGGPLPTGLIEGETCGPQESEVTLGNGAHR